MPREFGYQKQMVEIRSNAKNTVSGTRSCLSLTASSLGRKAVHRFVISQVRGAKWRDYESIIFGAARRFGLSTITVERWVRMLLAPLQAPKLRLKARGQRMVLVIA